MRKSCELCCRYNILLEQNIEREVVRVKRLVIDVFYGNEHNVIVLIIRELDGILKKIAWPYILAPGASNIPKGAGVGGERKNSKSSSGTMSTTDLAVDFERVFINLLHIQLPYPLKINIQHTSCYKSGC